MAQAIPGTETDYRSIRLSVTDFGPIAQGEVDLRPLTVFVGPSNSGKTYFAILFYALHGLLEGLPKIPLLSTYYPYLWSESSGTQGIEQEVLDLSQKLEANSAFLRFRDFPTDVRDALLFPLNDANILGADLETELGRCFDLETVAHLVRWSASTGTAELKLDVRERGQDLWQLQARISESGITPRCFIENPLLILESSRQSNSGNRVAASRTPFLFQRYLKQGDHQLAAASLLEELVMQASLDQRPSKAHYLPAARSGIMQSHRVIASSMIKLATRAGLQFLPEIPTFSGVMVDFMEKLILFQDQRKGSIPMENLAQQMERAVLGGRIRASRTSSEAYPEFVYHPQGAKGDIGLTRTSSMVSELAPVVLFLRGVMGKGDWLIIEEPEAHLHPAAQTSMAQLLGRMVRAGLKVVITTHSDWLLKEIGNLIREGELEANPESDDTRGPHWLKPNEVGTWLFRKESETGSSTVEEIPFDRTEGIEPQDYEAVAEELYNRSASLQDRWEESQAGSQPA
ncbi:MAG: AAA family ATPase [Caldilineaceae bacterium]|nr:AAA family ATPase [Caldilineaceae bacterium]